MMRQPSRDMAALIDGSVIPHSYPMPVLLGYAVNLFIYAEPQTPDTCVTIFDTGGLAPAPHLSYERNSFQIRVRANKYSDAYELLQAIKSNILGVHNLTIQDVAEDTAARYIGIFCESDIISLPRDEKNRATLTLNFITHRTDPGGLG